MAHSKQVTMYVSFDGKFEHMTESVVDAYNALDHIKDLTENVDVSFSDLIDEILPDIDSFIGALKELKKIKDESGTGNIKEALKKL